MSTSARATEPPRSATAQHRDSSNSFIVAPQWIGDAVMTEPLLRRLSMRGERLTVGALPSVVAVYRAMPQVSEVVELPFQRGHVQWRARHTLGRQLAGRFDTAYVLPNSLKSALLPVLAGIPKRVGYLGEARVGLLTHRLRNPGGKKKLPMVAFYSALAGEPGVEQDRRGGEREERRARAVGDPDDRDAPRAGRLGRRERIGSRAAGRDGDQRRRP